MTLPRRSVLSPSPSPALSLAVPVAFAVALAFLPAPAAAQVLVLEQDKLFASDAQAFDEFGHSVAVDGLLMVVGAPRHQESTGAAYVFARQDGQWVEQQLLTASDGLPGDNFGWDVDVSQGRIVVGSPFDDSRGQVRGSVYVFEFVDGAWTEAQRLQSADGRPGENFGWSVALDQGRLVAGAPQYDLPDDTGRTGRAYVFDRGLGDWQQTQTLSAGNDFADDHGWDVALDGDRVVVGAPAPDTRGVAFVYQLENGYWVEQALRPGDAGGAGKFAETVAIDGDLVAVGDPAARFDGVTRGRVSLFQWNGTEWIEFELVEANALSNSDFGSSLALSGGTLAVGAREHSFQGAPQSSGGVFSYRFDGSRLVSLRTMRVSNPTRNQWLGSAIDLDQGTLVAGVARDEEIAQAAGAAYVFLDSALALEVTPDELREGDQVRLRSCGGLYGGFVVLYVQAVDGVPYRRWLTSGRFRDDGAWDLQNTVPPGLAGIDMTLSTIGFVAPDEIAESNLQTIRLR